MKQAVSLRGFSPAKQIAFTALFASLCCIGTVLIVVPLPASGYFNAGDIFVLLSAWCLGPLFGSVASAVGSALADIVSGFAIYAPATFLIKGLDALVAYTVYAFLKKRLRKESLDFIPRALSALLGESVMLAGYLLYDAILYGLAAAVGGLLGNGMQGLFCFVLATALVAALYPIKAVRQLFPDLKK